jgi:uncharacterized protein
MRGTFTHYNRTSPTTCSTWRTTSASPSCPWSPSSHAKPGDPCALTEADKPILYEQYELLAKDMLRRERAGKPITFYHYMIDLAHGPCIISAFQAAAPARNTWP